MLYKMLQATLSSKFIPTRDLVAPAFLRLDKACHKATKESLFFFRGIRGRGGAGEGYILTLSLLRPRWAEAGRSLCLEFTSA